MLLDSMIQASVAVRGEGTAEMAPAFEGDWGTGSRTAARRSSRRAETG